MANALRQLRDDLLRLLDGVEEEARPDPLRAVLDEEMSVRQLVRQMAEDGRLDEAGRLSQKQLRFLFAIGAIRGQTVPRVGAVRGPKERAIVKDRPVIAAGQAPKAKKPDSLETSPVTGRKSLGGGVNTTEIVTLQDGSKAVWKPTAGESPGLRPGLVPDGTQYRREAAAYALAKGIGMEDMVPKTFARTVGSQAGSIQEFVGDAEVAKAVQSQDRYDGPRDLARAAVFDYVIGNTDRHAGNWMVTSGGRLKLIDNGLAFPVKNPFAEWGNFRILREADERADVWGRPISKLERPSALSPFDEARRALVGKWPAVRRSLKAAGLEDEAIRGVAGRWRAITKPNIRRLRDLTGDLP